MRKTIIHISLIVVFIVVYLLQSIFFNNFTIAGIMPNLFVILMMFIGLYMGRTMGVIYGIIYGIFIDLWIGKNIGLTSVALATIGLLTGLLEKTLSKDSRITVLLMGIISTIVYEVVLYFMQYIIYGINIELLIFIKTAILCLNTNVQKMLIDKKVKIDEINKLYSDFELYDFLEELNETINNVRLSNFPLIILEVFFLKISDTIYIFWMHCCYNFFYT